MSNQIIDFETLHAMNREDWQAPFYLPFLVAPMRVGVLLNGTL